jgi:hypothetical protein
MPKHEIDPTTQASMLAPEPGKLAVSAAVEIEGAYYEAPPVAEPSSEPEVLSPEQQRIANLKAEDVALDFLGRAAGTERRISSMFRGKYALEMSGVDEPKQVRLAERIERSEVTKARFKRVAKKHFGLSIGIETEEVKSIEFIESKGIEEEVIKVKAKDSSRQPELSSRYRTFLKDYKGSKKSREARRDEIAEQIGEA